MYPKSRKITALAVLLCMLALLNPISASAYTPQVTTLKVGLNYGTSALGSANLKNAAGSGFEFGYFDAQRVFIPLAWTAVNSISMVKDRTVYYYTESTYPEYREGTSGQIIIGCFHVQLSAPFATFDEARLMAANYQSSFVKYDNGSFYVCIGNYTARSDAEYAITQMGLSAAVTAGTSNTISVVETGTDRILFEFDGGAGLRLGVMPVSVNGEKTETWFRGYRYYGGFQYARLAGENMTVVNFVGVEDYVKGVLPHEMNNAWPMEALKAQACCARTYAMANLNKHSLNGFDICISEHCQVYGGRNGTNERTDRAVDETAGMYITYNGALCQTFFFSSDGGATEDVENVWLETIPYLRGVIDPYEADIISKVSNYSWTITYTPDQLTQRMRNNNYNCGTIVSMAVTEYSQLGNVVRVTLTDSNGSTFTLAKRDKLNLVLGVPSIRFSVGGAKAPDGVGSIYVNGSAETLDSSEQNYAIGGDGSVSQTPGGSIYAINGGGSVEIVKGQESTGMDGSADGKINGVFTITGTGRGHSVGMSQWGAYSMAEYHGKTYIDIINFYFTGVTIG